jgi:hypothetical protein
MFKIFNRAKVINTEDFPEALQHPQNRTFLKFSKV